jgi:TetR/AcrR family transcriptional repressor of nem operon
MTSRNEQKEQTHHEILQSAARLLRDQGIAGASVADVMRGAGLTVGGFYAHFESKDALIDETLRQTGAALRETLFARLDKKPPEARAEIVLKRYLSAAHRDQEDDGCLLPALTGEVGSTAREHAAVLGEQIEALVEGLAEHLSLKGRDNRRQLSLGLCALMVGGLSLSRALAGTTLSDDMLKACRALGIDAVQAAADKKTRKKKV